MGPAGFQGWSGEKGVTGPNGPTGHIGQVGQSGFPGRQGPLGVQGPPGLNGAWEVVKRISQRRISNQARPVEADIWRQHDQQGTYKGGATSVDWQHGPQTTNSDQYVIRTDSPVHNIYH